MFMVQLLFSSYFKMENMNSSISIVGIRPILYENNTRHINCVTEKEICK